ncbi:MAG: LEA type 2 family protein [Cyclobacteriaceae bacterium]|jgi:LEA14-like dessication related protein|nr:LEA type 2 family protein [Cyclobacteriaceae bacterium]
MKTIKTAAWAATFLFFAAGCVPDERIVFKNVREVAIEVGPQGDPLVKGLAQFHNPNRVAMNLREINLEVFVDGKKSAHVQQRPKLKIPAQGDFTVPIEMQLSLKELGLLDTLRNLFGGKKYQLRYVGYLRVRVHGVVVKVPVDYKDELRLKI